VFSLELDKSAGMLKTFHYSELLLKLVTDNEILHEPCLQDRPRRDFALSLWSWHSCLSVSLLMSKSLSTLVSAYQKEGSCCALENACEKKDYSIQSTLLSGKRTKNKKKRWHV